jgi:hypothetical protein
MPVAVRETQSKELLEFAISDVYPLVLEPASLRIRLWLQRLLGDALAPVLPQTRQRAADERSGVRRGGARSAPSRQRDSGTDA